jgi:hypothetical protein
MIAFLYLAANLILLHPFHVSVCDMVYDSDDKQLKISVRLFLDDLEVGLTPLIDKENYDITDKVFWEDTQQALESYFQNNLAISVKGKAIEYTYLGSEIEVDAMWCYIEVTKLRPFDEMTVKYTALKEVFTDQENLVHVRRDGDVKSCRIYGEKTEDTLIWE